MGAREGVVVRRARVPAVRAAALLERARVLHEGDAPALDRVRDERLRHVLRPGVERRERLAQGRVVVPVAGGDVPAERAQLRLEVAEGEDLLRGLVRLELVPVDDHPEPAEPPVRRGLQRLPVLALLQLAVAGHHDDAAAAAEQALRPRDPAALRDPHPERAGVRLDPGHAHVRVPVEAAEPAQLQEALVREHAERVERRVEARGRRGPSTRRTRRGSGRPSRARRRSARGRAGGRRGRAR